MLSQAEHYKDVELVHLLTLGELPWADRRFEEVFKINSFFLRAELRQAVNASLHDYTPLFLSELPGMFSGGEMPIDVALVAVTPPDALGYCSLGPSVDAVQAACRSASRVVAQINGDLPRTLGDAFIHRNEIDFFIEQDEPPPEFREEEPDDVARRIGEYVAQLIEDGATLHTGFGQIPRAVLQALKGHQGLGLHSEVFSDSMREAIERGLIDNSRKQYHAGRSVTTFAAGSRAHYRFLHENPHIEFGPAQWVSNPAVIARNERMSAVNSALAVSLLGQAANESISESYFSGIGGQSDFMRGASLSRGGMALIALPSLTPEGSSRIRVQLGDEHPVVNLGGDAHYVVTEYGVATLRGRSLRERALEMIQIAHPQHRETLLREARARRIVPAYQVNVPRPAEGIGDLGQRKVRLKDGTYLLRPLHPSDERRLQEFFYSHSRETIQQRYGYMVSRMTRQRAYELVGIDQSRDLALGVFEVQGPRQVIHAVGRYFLDADGTSAEMAFVVRETKRRLGMGGLLLETMIEAARRRGVRTLWAQTASENVPMLAVFKEKGARITPSKEPGEHHVEIGIAPES